MAGMSSNWWWLLWIAVGYLSGSVPFGLLLGRAKGVDLRQSGSGNIGATNASRVLGRRWGVLCFALDVLKGWLPVFVAGTAMGVIGDPDLSAGRAWLWLAVAAVAVLGHVFPIWLGLRGGKGVATGFGVLLGFWPMLTLPAFGALAVWLVLMLTLRYVSVASMSAAVSLPLWVAAFAHLRDENVAPRWPFIAATAAMALLVLVRHRANLSRLFQGTEPKAGAR